MNIILLGGNGALGLNIKNYLESAGHLLAVADISNNEFGLENYWSFDATSSDSVATTLCEFTKEHGRISALVNLVGIIENGPFYSPMKPDKYLSMDHWQNILDINLNTAFVIAKEYHKYAIEHKIKCNMINFSSVASSGNRGQIAYSVSKAALESLTQNLALELGPRGHRFNAISPGYIDVDSTKKHITATKLELIKEKISLRKLGDAKSIGKAVEFIIQTDYLNGQVIKVDGGFF